MAFDILPHGVEDPTSLVITGGGASDFSAVVALDSPQYGGLGCIVEFTAPLPDGDLDLIIQTAIEDVGIGAVGWIDTASRIRISNQALAGDAFQIPCADPVIDKVRLKVVWPGAAGPVVIVRWLADRPLPALA